MGHVELTQVLVKFLAAKSLEQICTFHMDVAKKVFKKQSSQACICSAMLVPFTSRFSRSCFRQCKRSGHQDALYRNYKSSNAKVQACYASQESQEVPLEQKRFELELGLQSLTQRSIETLGIDMSVV